MIPELLCFLLGVHLSVMLVASCYRMIDLWYRIGDFIFRILARIVVITALNAIFILSFQGDFKIALISGQLFFFAFHIGFFWFGRVLVTLLTRFKSF